MPDIKDYWEPSFETLYQAYYQELASEALETTWQKIDIVQAILVAITASGSAIAGWALWSEPGGKIAWVIIAGIASVLSIIHGTLGVPGRIKDQEDIRREFSELRLDLEKFRQRLALDLIVDEASKQYNHFLDRYTECMKKTHPDLAYTKRLRNRVQRQVNERLRVGG